MTIKNAILVSLDRVAPMLLPEQTLWHDVNATLSKPITIAELRAALAALEIANRVISVRNDLQEQLRYRITDLGLSDLLT